MKSIGESDPTGAANSAHFRKVQIVGAPIAVVSLPKVLSVFENWVANKEDRFVLLRDVHGAMQARNNEPVRRAQNSADMVLPDGVPFVWAVRGLGVTSITRVCGIDLLPAACRFGVDKKWRHYFYGASPGVADQLSRTFREIDPDIEIVGTYCPHSVRSARKRTRQFANRSEPRNRTSSGSVSAHRSKTFGCTNTWANSAA